MEWWRHFFPEKPFPEEWVQFLQEKVHFYPHLPREDREKFHRYVQRFISKKQFTGLGGLVIEDPMKVVIAAAAVRLVLHVGLAPYDRLSEILVYPDAFRSPDSDEYHLGESHDWGIVVLSWDAVLKGFEANDGFNTAYHEFAHALDRASGAFDGTPPLGPHQPVDHWAQIMTKHFIALRRGKNRELSVLDPYGAVNEAEFFAVATEAFFEQPRPMKKLLPDLYEQLQLFYKFDPIQNRRVS